MTAQRYYSMRVCICINFKRLRKNHKEHKHTALAHVSCSPPFDFLTYDFCRPRVPRDMLEGQSEIPVPPSVCPDLLGGWHLFC
ncbi:hypothetical protein EVAR_38784_1 [Eumeta japonica]|uniref:Uncharacterized protein n=1 Tax=Eumeta variegata TaxID=151549 RepID=A0A4C1WKL1_EUMVA|nr:hypothetical protein EVAR_38784_1 [Eumeta japonica]